MAAVGVLALLATACGDDSATGDTTTGDTTTGETTSGDAPTDGSVAIVDFAFEPREVRIEPGEAVTWTNGDDAPHTVQDTSDLGVEESPDLQRGDSFSTTYKEPGTYAYVCGIHNFMTATVVVEA